MESKNEALAQRLAIARLKHRVNEMETQVEYDRRLQPPIKKVFDCIVDDTALIAALQEIRRWVSKGGIEITIPIATLQKLDRLKKGENMANINAREAIRYIERAAAGTKRSAGVNIQPVTDKFTNWEDCEAYAKKMNPHGQGIVAPAPPIQILKSDGRHRKQEAKPGPPKEVEAIINCALYRQRKYAANGHDNNREYLIVSLHPEVLEWARYYGIRVVSPSELAALVADAERQFANRLHQYQVATGSVASGNKASPTSPGRGTNGRGRIRDVTVSPRAMDRNDGSFVFNSPPRSGHGIVDVGRGRGYGRGSTTRTLWEPN